MLRRFGVLVAALGLSFPAQALTITPVAGDAALIAALGGPTEPLMRFVGEGRIGDLGGNATFEYDVGTSTAAPASTGNLAWANGENYVFSFDFDAASKVATLALGSNANLVAGSLKLVGAPYVASFLVPDASGISDLYLRARATPSSYVLFEDLQLQLAGGGLFDVPGYTGTNTGSGPVSPAIVRLSGENFAGGFTLGGSATLAWDPSDLPRNSELAFQFKVATIPEPGTLALVIGGILTMGAISRRRMRQL